MTPAHFNPHFDVIMIGSGMGALAASSILAQVGKKRVLLLERHFKPGGFTHSFRRKKFEWDVGVHYVGQMQTGSMTRRMMDLVTRRGVQWHAMGAVYDRMMFPTESFDLPVGEENFRDKLIQRFPGERAAIIRYFKDVHKAANWMARWFVSKQYPWPIGKSITLMGRRLATMTTAQYMDRFKDPLLVAILTGQWPDFGTPPSRSAFGFHAVVTADYFNGGYYPIGGSRQIATQAIKAVEDAGGCCLVNHTVEEIVIKNRKAVGVKVTHQGKELLFTAPVVVSNAGGPNTFCKLIHESIETVERERALRCKRGPSAMVLFLGLKEDPRRHNFGDMNYWLYHQLEHNDPFSNAVEENVPIPAAFVSFGSLRNPGQEPHTAQVISIGHSNQWQAYEKSTWKRRGDQYEQQKQAIAERLLDFVYTRLPRLKELIDYQEVSTPLTIQSFTDHPHGMIYGQECDRARLAENAWPISTSIGNLYLTGSDVGTPGINGALMAGVMTAGKLLGSTGMPRIFSKAYRK